MSNVRAATLATVLLLAAACGSTAEDRHLVGSDARASNGGLGEPLGVGTDGDAVAGGGPRSSPGSTSGVATDAGPSSDAGVGPGGSASVPTRAAPGSTEPVQIGIAYKKGLEEAGAATGFKISGGDAKAIFDAVIDEINASGGLAGRPLEPVYGTVEAASSESGAQIDQRLCALWTQDHQVEAVATPGAYSEVMPACLQDKNVPFLFVTSAPSDEAAYAQFPSMHSLYPGQYRATAAWIDTLVDHGWFAGASTKIGMFRYDERAQERIAEDVLKPALARHGLELTAETAISRDEQGLAAGKSALLRFQSEGVTHILPLDPDGNMTLLGMKLAEGNGYHPRWAMTSYVLPYIQQTNNQSQLSGAAGLGWAPTIDVDESRDPGATPARDRCLEVMREHGVQVVDRTSVFAVAYSCDLLFLLQEIANRAGGLEPAAFRDAVASISAFDSAAFAGIGFNQTRRDGASRARYFEYVDSCSCFEYQSDPFDF